MMKYVVLAIFLGVAAARPQQAKNDEVVIVRSEFEDKGDGTFNWASETSDGTKIEQQGFLKNPGTEDEGISISGSYQYYAPEGELISLKYIADEKGFQPEGEHLPTPPPIPEAIQKALEIIYRNAEQQAASFNRETFAHAPSRPL
ncbi:unnamed protein product [Orchesella dallaii]|uniref:Uncharacterized protein n=1 Tax=Orchesella dallaii TaxID=48710 RepID=A0ABP1QGV0_9HEXA